VSERVESKGGGVATYMLRRTLQDFIAMSIDVANALARFSVVGKYPCPGFFRDRHPDPSELYTRGAGKDFRGYGSGYPGATAATEYVTLDRVLLIQNTRLKQRCDHLPSPERDPIDTGHAVSYWTAIKASRPSD